MIPVKSSVIAAANVPRMPQFNTQDTGIAEV